VRANPLWPEATNGCTASVSPPNLVANRQFGLDVRKEVVCENIEPVFCLLLVI
jgi:hypothetical protein